MKLTNYEKEMLNGDHGEVRQQAMQVLYDLAAFHDVDRFVEIVGCHDDSTVYAGEAQVAFAEMLAEKGARFAVPTTTNATACDMLKWHRQKHDVEVMSATRRIEASHIKMGAIPTWSCAIGTVRMRCVTSPSVSLRSERRIPFSLVSFFGTSKNPLVASPPLRREKV